MAVGGGLKAVFGLDTTSFTAGLKKAAKEYDRRAKRAITLGVLFFESEVKKELSKPGTGRARKTKGKRGLRGGVRLVSGSNRASAPGHPPAVDTGQFRSSITHLVEREFVAWVGKVGTGIKDTKGRSIGAHLEFGTSKMAARPFMMVTLERIRPQLLALFSRVLSG